MSVSRGMSKGERSRVKIRVRTAMAAQAQIEGRFPRRALGLRHRRGPNLRRHPSPSAHGPARNSHRVGIAWSKGAVRAIVTNPAIPATRCGTGRNGTSGPKGCTAGEFSSGLVSV
jgi:hypothetical protein